MPELVKNIRDFLKDNGTNNQIVYILNHEDETYYTIDNCRIDTEGDVVFDISYST